MRFHRPQRQLVSRCLPLLVGLFAACGSNSNSGSGSDGGPGLLGIGHLGVGGASVGSLGAGGASVGTIGAGGSVSSGAGAQKELADGTIGSSCGTCGTGLVCSGTVTNGYCTKACTATADCGSGASCHGDVGAEVCFRNCAVDTDCRPAYECQLDPATSSKICLPTSGGGSSSGAGGASSYGAGGASTATGTHRVLSDGTVGSSCGTCVTGLTCVTDAPDGYCTKACTSSADCGASASCHDDNGLVCFRDCVADADCRQGYSCVKDPRTSTSICYPM